jgi:hypothetical protein
MSGAGDLADAGGERGVRIPTSQNSPALHRDVGGVRRLHVDVHLHGHCGLASKGWPCRTCTRSGGSISLKRPVLPPQACSTGTIAPSATSKAWNRGLGRSNACMYPRSDSDELPPFLPPMRLAGVATELRTTRRLLGATARPAEERVRARCCIFVGCGGTRENQRGEQRQQLRRKGGAGALMMTWGDVTWPVSIIWGSG